MSDVNKDNLLDKNDDFGQVHNAARIAVWDQIPVKTLHRMHRWEETIGPQTERVRETLLVQLEEQVQR